MIELYTAATPNGWKVSIALEELELEYQVRRIALGKREQKERWYVALNPNGRIPTIVDHDRDGFTVFESGAILLYLAEKTGKLLPATVNGRSRVIQWLMWQMAGLGPMMGQANVFYRYAPEKIPYATARYQRETRRLLGVLDRQLRGRDYIVDDYSIADIACWAWAYKHNWSGVTIDGLDALRGWIERISQRPAVQRGIRVPRPLDRAITAELGMIEAARKILV